MEKQSRRMPFGGIRGVAAAERDEPESGSIRLVATNVLQTDTGPLIPLYTGGDLVSLTLGADGAVLSVEMESPQEIETPAGPFLADGVTFYPSGAIESVRIGRGKAAVREFEHGYKPFAVAVKGLKFYESGALREIVFAEGAHADVWPEQYWRVRARFGVTLHESGEIMSIEPAHPVKAITPCGTYDAYDPNAGKTAGEHWSLRFDTLARVTAVTTAGDRVYVRPITGSHYAEYVPDLSGEQQIPLRLQFDYDAEKVAIFLPDGRAAEYTFEDEFIVYPNAAAGCAASECDECGLCDK
ncbi:MAG: hypothetical protein GX189_04950 [Clostridiales bacterium]|nr:hypothetical protein [Clostridiales bacterium]